MTKFHCRRQFGMNFGNVTENGVNSNVTGFLLTHFLMSV